MRHIEYLRCKHILMWNERTKQLEILQAYIVAEGIASGHVNPFSPAGVCESR